MKKILVAVDETRGSKAILSAFRNLVLLSKEIVLVHVVRLEGKSLMIEMLGDAEMSTLKEMLEGTEYKDKLDRKAEKILTYYKKELDGNGPIPVKTVIRHGHPVEEILKAAEEEGVDMIIMGCNGKRGIDRLISGCVTRDVEKRARVSVLVAKTGGCEKAYSLKEVKEAYAIQ